MYAQQEAVSTPDNSRSAEEESTRSRLLIDAAAELLEQGGIEGLTVRAVLKRTGLARRAFYERFVGKDDLVVAVFEETLREAARRYREEAKQLDTPLDKLRMVVVGLVRGAFDNEHGIGQQRVFAMVHEHLRLAQSRPGELQAALRPLLEFIAEQVTEGIRTGQLRDCDPDLQARLIYNLVATTLHSELLMKQPAGYPHERSDQLVGEIWEFCRRAIIA